MDDSVDKSKKDKPIASVLPNAKEVTTPDVIRRESNAFDVDFGDLKVSELSNKLRNIGLVNLSKMCSSDSLDGKFFETLSKDDMAAPPFSLTPLQIMKFFKLKNEGWTPTH